MIHHDDCKLLQGKADCDCGGISEAEIYDELLELRAVRDAATAFIASLKGHRGAILGGDSFGRLLDLKEALFNAAP